ncbi:MAG TPA: D-alanyl-D-alanine endopeptidase [Burkholderiales bacterium]|nr:D-alanyl-D-alanine endopeptidase [Burkholderiales bacterium]
MRILHIISLLFLAICIGNVQAAGKKPSQQRKTVSKAVAGAKTVQRPVHQIAYRQSGKQRVARRTVAPPPPEVFNPDVLDIQSTAALVINPSNGNVIYDKNIGAVAPIASITKLMTAMVVLDAKLAPDETITLTEEDLDYVKYTGSRLQIGMALTRDEMLRLALMSSENRAASALGRAYPGGMPAFVREMNLKALSLEMTNTSFVDSTGLSSSNVSTAQDLAKMVTAAYQYPLIRQYSTGNGYSIHTHNGRAMQFGNSNSLIVSPNWHINLSKTGYIREAGRCLVMHTTIANSPIVIVLLDSWGRLSRVGDANRIKKWIEYHAGRTLG